MTSEKLCVEATLRQELERWLVREEEVAELMPEAAALSRRLWGPPKRGYAARLRRALRREIDAEA